MKKQTPARSSQSSSTVASQALPLLAAISILAIIFITVFKSV